MKFNNSFIQSIGIIMILAKLPDDGALKSQEISQRMNVSHSYLLKIAKKLKDAELINSIASKTGGYVLNKSVDKISFLDILHATEGKNSFIEGIDFHPIDSIVSSNETGEEKRIVIRNIFSEAEKNYKDILNNHYISEIISQEEESNQKTNWTEMIDLEEKELLHS
ncbi:Rrf2 family transcriptional regulator [Melissococcus plutonius]|uniref:Rrf2 family transcriptional regulator n=1 Tax=Melissococcus plutonius TaxID=33970 RepID=A0A2Z5Y4T6_9ENTE|nr:Rrf2 family transcriptional regulator [Melissococcus plutonius]BAL62962.1 Rrf2 family transcriptional regulator [Melissococcus plutonius DAT561]MCV2498917.1 Rrf2 family transcriptional regulator [Melissococcus plutonius]MCV2501551.1 Rrf2 family transcriptional regulator [Melissococcus plutonius]MCV2505803.1 Rrf2 family transcriptional regulator [Melissococcus plutonius]MCV2508090.1 Rrf2 family transcriptional regulator [Melissococcus plutonius]